MTAVGQFGSDLARTGHDADSPILALVTQSRLPSVFGSTGGPRRPFRSGGAARVLRISPVRLNFLLACVAWIVCRINEGCAGRANGRAFRNRLNVFCTCKMYATGWFSVAATCWQGLKLIFVPNIAVSEIPHAR